MHRDDDDLFCAGGRLLILPLGGRHTHGTLESAVEIGRVGIAAQHSHLGNGQLPLGVEQMTGAAKPDGLNQILRFLAGSVLNSLPQPVRAHAHAPGHCGHIEGAFIEQLVDDRFYLLLKRRFRRFFPRRNRFCALAGLVIDDHELMVFFA